MKFIIIITIFCFILFPQVNIFAADEEQVETDPEEGLESGQPKQKQQIEGLDSDVNQIDSVKKQEAGGVEEPQEELPEPHVMEKKRGIETSMPYLGKNIYAAGALSLLVGFGTGNFYSENYYAAYASMLLQAVTIGGLVGVLAYTWSYDTTHNMWSDYWGGEFTTTDIMFHLAFWLAIGTKVFDTTSAVVSAYNYNHERRFKLHGLNISPFVVAEKDNNIFGLQFKF